MSLFCVGGKKGAARDFWLAWPQACSQAAANFLEAAAFLFLIVCFDFFGMVTAVINIILLWMLWWSSPSARNQKSHKIFGIRIPTVKNHIFHTRKLRSV
jgi:hypothetical protein